MRSIISLSCILLSFCTYIQAQFIDYSNGYVRNNYNESNFCQTYFDSFHNLSDDVKTLESTYYRKADNDEPDEATRRSGYFQIGFNENKEIIELCRKFKDEECKDYKRYKDFKNDVLLEERKHMPNGSLFINRRFSYNDNGALVKITDFKNVEEATISTKDDGIQEYKIGNNKYTYQNKLLISFDEMGDDQREDYKRNFLGQLQEVYVYYDDELRAIKHYNSSNLLTKYETVIFKSNGEKSHHTVNQYLRNESQNIKVQLTYTQEPFEVKYLQMNLYSYNEQGQLIRHEIYYQGKFDRTRTFSYNESGDLIKIISNNYKGETITEFEYEDFDWKGNWLKQSTFINGELENIKTRKIEYFNE